MTPQLFTPADAAAKLNALAASLGAASTETLTVKVVRFDPATATQLASDLGAIATMVAAIPAPVAPAPPAAQPGQGPVPA